jgi:protein NRD1
VLTEADRKWLRTAEFGGTGGQEIMQGMVVEEPDIEIGAGPSSKGEIAPINQCLFTLTIV